MALVHELAKGSIELIAIYFHSFEMLIIQIGEIGFCKPELFSSQIIFRILKKANSFWIDFEALVCEIDVRMRQQKIFCALNTKITIILLFSFSKCPLLLIKVDF
jgi:hypothetical protein